MEVEVLVPTAERGPVARVVEQPRDLAAQRLPVAALGEHGLRQLHLPLHELLRLLRVRVLQPAVGVGDLDAVVGVDDGLVAAGGRVGEADGVAGDGAHGGGGGGAREEEEGAAAAAIARRWEGDGFRSEHPAEEGERFVK